MTEQNAPFWQGMLLLLVNYFVQSAVVYLLWRALASTGLGSLIRASGEGVGVETDRILQGAT